MTNEEQAACLEFAKTFGWPEWMDKGHEYRFIYRGQLCWRLESKDQEGFWHDCLGYCDEMARDRWICWLLEEGHKFIKTITTCGVAGDIHWEIIMIDDDEIYGETLLLGLLDGVSQAKRQEAGK